MFIPTEYGEVVAIEAETGEVTWRQAIHPAGMLRTLELAVWQNLLLVGAEHLADLPAQQCKLRALDIETGMDAWSLSLKGDSLSPIVVEKNTAYFTSSEPRLYALDLPTRQVIWSVATRSWSPETVAVAEDIIIVPSRGPLAVAYSRQDGRQIWLFTAGDEEMLNQRPVFTADTVYVCGWGKHLYALERATGALRWCFSTERGLTSPPILSGEKLFIGVKDYHSEEGKRQPGYGVVALDAATGQTLWKFSTRNSIYTCPAVTTGVVMIGADDCSLYALDLENGQELWQYTAANKLRAGPVILGSQVIVGQVDGALLSIQWQTEPPAPPDFAALIAAGKPLEAAEALALGGRYVEAAQLYAGQGQLENAAVLYLEANLPASAVELYIKMNQLEKALAVCRQAGDRPGEARILALQEDHCAAANLYEELGSLDLAVQEYQLSGRTAYAAALLQKAGRRREAAELFRSINENDRAAEALIEDGRYVEGAEVYLGAGKLAAAAGLLARAGRFADAAALNEKVGNLPVAAEQYIQAGLFDHALNIYENLGDWSSVVELAERAGNPERKANALIKLGQRQQAAEIYERAGRLEAALDLYKELENWAKAAEIAGRLEIWNLQAENLLHLGLLTQAAEAYVRCAERLQRADPLAQVELARLYESAEKYFTESNEYERAAACREVLCQINGWPNLKGQIEESQFIQGEYRKVKLVIFNTGRGLAQNIDVLKISRKFELDDSESRVGIRVLAPDQANKLYLSVRPRSDVIGQASLRVTLLYTNQTGHEFQSVISQDVKVLGRDEKYRDKDLTPFPEELIRDLPAGIDPVRIRRGLAEYFNLEELDELSFELKVDYENLPGDTKSKKSMELVRYMLRNQRIEELLGLCRQRRPNVTW